MSEEKKKPEIAFRIGRVNGAVWRHVVQGTGEAVYNVTLVKRVKEKESENYKDVTTFYPDELPAVALIAERCYEFIKLVTMGEENSPV